MASVERRVRNGEVRWYARWRDPEGRQRSKTFRRRVDADRFVTRIAADVYGGAYMDPDAGTVTFEQYAKEWLAAQTFDESTRQATEIRLRLHVFPVIGRHRLRDVKPLTIQAWLRGLDGLARTYQRVIFSNVSSIFSAAVDDDRIRRNPCRAGSVRPPRIEPRKVEPWTPEQVLAVRAALPERYQIVATIGAGLGLRQGEVFGLSPEDVDFLRGLVMVRRQVKLVHDKQVFALPKNRKTRQVPLPAWVMDALAEYLTRFPARTIELPEDVTDGDALSVPLVVTTRESRAISRGYFNQRLWKPALVAAGLAPTRSNGMQALRHFYASVQLEGGTNIRALSDYLGHGDPGFTLRIYTHLMPSSTDAARRAVDDVFRPVDGEARGLESALDAPDDGVPGESSDAAE